MFKDDYKKVKSFYDNLLPLLQKKLNADKIISFEDMNDNSVSKLFDINAGIDAVSISSKGLRGIALRIQYDIEYNTFTIRYERSSGAKTELSKRIEAIKKGYIYPYLTCQCYYNEKNIKLLSGAICRTSDLYKFAEDNIETLEQNKRRCPEGNYFLWITFKEFEESGYKIVYF